MKMQDFMQKIKEKKLKRSDWLILVLAGILILIIALPTDTKRKKTGRGSKKKIFQRKIIPWRHLRMK